MNRYRIVYVVLTIVLGISACLSLPYEKPGDLSLKLEWNTGALPPRYHYSYCISIDPQGTGEFFYHPGYKDDTENDLYAEFLLSTNQVDVLYQYLLENNLLRKNWEIGRPLMGGKGTSISINADGKEFIIPSVSELTEDDRDLVNEAIDYINNLVPQEIWDEMEARQEAIEELYAENE